MRRKVLGVVFTLGLGLLIPVLLSCGGGYSNNKNNNGGCTGGPYNVTGDWLMTVSGNGGSVSGPGVISSSGQAVFFQTSNTVPAPGDTVVLPTITGACSFSGTATAYATAASGGGTASDSVTGKVSSSSSISGTLSNGNTISLAPSSPLSGSVVALSGAMLGEVEGSTQAYIWQLNLTPTGTDQNMSLTGNNGQGCNVSGTFTQEGGGAADLNVFDVAMTFSGTACPADINGVGFASSSDYFQMNGGAPGTYFYAVSSTGAVVLEIFP